MKRVAVVTGGASGIGKATIGRFAKAGWEPIGVDITKPDTELKKHPFYQIDVTDPDAVQALFESLEEKYDHLDALINNAATQVTKPFIEMSVEEWDLVMASNLKSVFLMTRAAYPLLKSASGSVVNISSVHSVATSVDIAAYAASKGGVTALTRALALEFASDPIRVNAILPGAVDTPMLRAGLERDHVEGEGIEERLEALAKKTPQGRIGSSAEIARAILFLADSDQSAYITGQALIIDGGATARLSTE